MSLVYLAGPIAGITGEEAVDWRIYAAKELSYFDIETRDPMRAKSHAWLGGNPISRNYTDYESKGTFFKSKAIMTRDFNDVKQSDCLLVNLLGAKTPSLGTIMELAWAFVLQKPCVVCIEPTGNPHDNHPMIHEAMGFRVSTLDEGIDATAIILGWDVDMRRARG